MGRRELREELQSTWHVYEAREPGVPFTEKDLEDAAELARLRAAKDETGAAPSTPSVHLSAMLPRALIGAGWRSR